MLGKGGLMLKKIGTAARLDIEKMMTSDDMGRVGVSAEPGCRGHEWRPRP